MIDAGRREVDSLLEEIEANIRAIYSEHQGNIEDQAAELLAEYEEQRQEIERQYKSGDIDEGQRKGRLSSLFVPALAVSLLASAMVDVDDRAAQAINKGRHGVFAAGMNFAAYCMDYRTALETEQTVREMLRTRPDLLPTYAINRGKDFDWVSRKMESAIRQGMSKGESIPKLAARLRGVVEMDKKAAIRNARTMATAISNQGCLERFYEVRAHGAKVRKKWLATNDSRTRASHAALNGEIRELEETFSNGLQYPGDPSGIPSEVYNCRCTMVSDGGNDPNDYKAYKEWRASNG